MCNLSQVATGARYLKGVDRVLLKSNMCSIWGATETTSQQRADEANSNERGGGQRTSKVEEEKLMLQSENWHENHEYASLRGPSDEK